MKEYTRTDNTGNTFRTVTFKSDNGDVAFVQRNQAHDPENWFLITGLLPKAAAIKKIDFFCRFAQ